MADSFAGDLGKAFVGVGVGFALYVLLTGGGGGFGLGRGGGSGRDEAAPPPPVLPPDAERLHFILRSTGLDKIEQRDGNWKPIAGAKSFTLDEVIARVHAGGRSDVALMVSGGALVSDIETAKARLHQAGLAVAIVEPSSVPPKVSGNPRGRYG